MSKNTWIIESSAYTDQTHTHTHIYMPISYKTKASTSFLFALPQTYFGFLFLLLSVLKKLFISRKTRYINVYILIYASYKRQKILILNLFFYFEIKYETGKKREFTSFVVVGIFAANILCLSCIFKRRIIHRL